MRLKDKVAIVTGAANGIGFATAQLMLQEGATVVFSDIQENASPAVQALTSITRAHYIQTDVSKEEQVMMLFDETINKYGKVDIVFANAGIGGSKEPVAELALERWQGIIEVNLTGVFLTNKHAIKQMLKQGVGVIVNNASILGHVGQKDHTVYPASKGAVVNMTRSLGITYAAQGIRINAVCPGYVETHLLDYLSTEIKEELTKLHPIGRLGRPEEIAKAVVFLASEDASFIVGANLLIDGGYTAQ